MPIIAVNGKLFGVQPTPLSYRDLADLAGFKSPLQPSMTLQYAKQRDQPQLEGRILAPGDSIIPVEGMRINVADTGYA